MSELSDAESIAIDIMRKQRERRVASRSKPYYPSATPATSLGYNCERRIVYQRCWPDKGKTVDEELASIFEEGMLHQTDVRRELSLIGYEVVEAELNFKDTKLDISGTIDGKIAISGEHRAKRIPVEIKSTQAHAPATSEEWRTINNSLLRRYYAQLQIYLYLTSEPVGLALFKQKATGLWTVVACDMDYAYVETLLKKAERIRDVVAKIKDTQDSNIRESLLPNRLLDRSECNGCPWKDTMCHPEEAMTDRLLLANDDKLYSQLVEREELDKQATRYDVLDKEIKERFKLTRGEQFIVGGSDGFIVEKRPHGKGIRIDISRLKQGEKQ